MSGVRNIIVKDIQKSAVKGKVSKSAMQSLMKPLPKSKGKK